MVDHSEILVIANDAVDGAHLRETIRDHGGSDRTEVLVVGAGAQLPASLLGLRRRPSAEARRGSPPALAPRPRRRAASKWRARSATASPLNAIADGLRVFPADEIVLVTHPAEEEHWVEHDLVERARSHFGLPIVHLVAGLRRLALAA